MTPEGRQAYGRMPAKPTPAALIDALIQTYRVSKIEELNGKRLPVDVRSLQRWKSKGWPGKTGPVLDALIDSGLLRSAEAGAEQDDDPLAILRQLSDSVAELAQSHREALADLGDVRTRLAQAEAALAPARAAATKRKAK